MGKLCVFGCFAKYHQCVCLQNERVCDTFLNAAVIFSFISSFFFIVLDQDLRCAEAREIKYLGHWQAAIIQKSNTRVHANIV